MSIIVGVEPPLSDSGCNSVCTSAWSYIPQNLMRCQSYFNVVHAKSYSHVATAPPPQCTAFTSIIHSTLHTEANDEGVWCATVDREVPSSLAANQATVEVPTTPPMTTEGAQGLSFTPLLMLSLLIGSVLLL